MVSCPPWETPTDTSYLGEPSCWICCGSVAALRNLQSKSGSDSWHALQRPQTDDIEIPPRLSSAMDCRRQARLRSVGHPACVQNRLVKSQITQQQPDYPLSVQLALNWREQLKKNKGNSLHRQLRGGLTKSGSCRRTELSAVIFQGSSDHPFCATRAEV